MLEKIGADGRIRTGDLLITNQLLYQRSYIGESVRGRIRARARRSLPADPDPARRRDKIR